jgi:uncharacterized membrane protein YqhA
MWYVVIHVVFVVSSVLLALSDRLTGEAKSAASASKSKADVGEAPTKGKA